MSINHWPASERPRERLLQLGAPALSDAELIAIFLRTGVRGKSAVDLARDLLQQFGGLRQLLESSPNDFCHHKGLGNAKYASLQAILEMARRHIAQCLDQRDVMTQPQDVEQYLIHQLRHRTQEVFCCLFLDAHHRIIRFEELFHGTIDRIHIYTREIIKRALQLNAVAIILSHNHPSGIAKPSMADKRLTLQLVNACKPVDIQVLDHFVIGESDVVSFAELGLLP